MTLNTKDWKKLQMPILVLVLTLCVVALLMSLALNFKEKQAALLRAQNTQLNITQQKYRASGTEKQDIITYLPQYKTLIKKGFVGEERRQLWIQSLHNIQKEHRLFPIKYQLNPLEQVIPNFYPNLSHFQMHRSTMKLHFDLLHEGDLLTLTETLAAKEYANWLLHDCEMTRLSQDQTNGANLTANCTINWFTLTEPNSQQTTQ